MANLNNLTPMLIRKRAATTFDGTWQPIGAAFDKCIWILRINNNTNMPVDISFNATAPHDQHDFLAASQVLQIGSMGDNFNSSFPVESRIYVRAAAGTGTIYLSGYCVFQ